MTARFDFAAGRFLFETHRSPGRVDFENPELPGILDGIREHGRAAVVADGPLGQAGQFAAEEDVVAENQRDGIAADEVAADDEGVRSAVRFILHGVGQSHSPSRTVA